MSSSSTLTTEELDQLFKHLQDEIQNYDVLCHSVQTFKQYIEQGVEEGIFDQQDIQWLDEDLLNLKREKEEKEHNLKLKKETYNGSVTKLEHILKRRTQLIEEADKVSQMFRFRPNLLKKFAQKRVTLMKIVEQGKQDLHGSV
jgi:chromosome segregation ATPase